jgi:hypothetical protein
MDLEKLYQSIYAQVFALTWVATTQVSGEDRAIRATNHAASAAEMAVKLWEPAKAHVAICTAQGLAPQEGG